jgi:hypothetical protein
VNHEVMMRGTFANLQTGPRRALHAVERSPLRKHRAPAMLEELRR